MAVPGVMITNLMRFLKKIIIPLASYMQGSTRQEYPLDAGGKRREIAEEIEAFCAEQLLHHFQLIMKVPIHPHLSANIGKQRRI